MPPSWARAIAMSASVTVSIAEDTSGMLSGISRVSWVAGVGLAWQDRGFERLQEDVVERQSERNFRGVVEVGHIGPCQGSSDSPRGG